VHDCQFVVTRRCLLQELNQTTLSEVASKSYAAVLQHPTVTPISAGQMVMSSGYVGMSPLELAAMGRQQDVLQSELRKCPNKLKDSMVVASRFSCEITIETIKRLIEPEWLNSELITFFNEYWAERIGGSSGQKMPEIDPKIYFSNTYFYTKMVDDTYCFQKIARWSKKLDIFALDRMIIPINEVEIHWFLAVINFKKQRIEIWDSMGSRHLDVIDALFRYLQDEHRAKKGSDLDISSWSCEPVDAPQQTNCHDCGVFCCMFAAYRAIDRPFDFSQDDMSRIRGWMMSVICETGGFICPV
jgi:sentrin-specific protease 1